MIVWSTVGQYEYEYSYSLHDYTGWYRCIGGRLANGRWPQWHSKTGDKRYA